MGKHKKRTVHIDGLAWSYVVGRKNLALTSPEGRKQIVPLETLLGRPQEDIDNARSLGANMCPPVPVAKRREQARDDEASYRRQMEAFRNRRKGEFWSLATSLKPPQKGFRKRDWYSNTWQGAMHTGMVRPSTVKAWIEIQILKRPAASAPPIALCECCGTDQKVHYGPNPFAEEVHGDMTCYHLCQRCADQIAMDI